MTVGHSADTRLIAYGTLAPGEVNEHQLADLAGRWLKGTVRGHRVSGNWYGDRTLPGFILGADEPPVDIHVFESHDLPAHWARLDAFEGPNYRRTIATVTLSDGSRIDGQIYEFIGEV